jgi:hypothetical protein
VIKLKELLKEDDYLKDAMNNGKKIFKKLQTIYPDIPKFKLVFKNLRGRGTGFLTTRRIGGRDVPIKMTVDSSGMSSYDADYGVCHEFAHAILGYTKGNLGHNRAHDNLTYKLAKKFGLA